MRITIIPIKIAVNLILTAIKDINTYIKIYHKEPLILGILLLFIVCIYTSP